MGFGLERNHRVDFLHFEEVGLVRIYWSELLNLWTVDKRHIIFIGRNHLVGIFLGGLFNEVEKACRHFLAVDDESAAENFVTAVLAVHLRETKHFAVGERTAEAFAKSLQIIHLFGAESQTFRLIVGFNIVDINDRIRRTSDSEGVAV